MSAACSWNGLFQNWNEEAEDQTSRQREREKKETEAIQTPALRRQAGVRSSPMIKSRPGWGAVAHKDVTADMRTAGPP
jgi:hypothetical protein